MIIEKDLQTIDIENIKSKSPIVLVGMPGICMVGRMAVLNFIKGLKAIEYKRIYYHDFPPHAIVNEKGKMEIPCVSLYYWENKNSNDLILITGQSQPSSAEGIYELSDYLCKYCEELNTKWILALGAFVPEEPVLNDRKVYISGSDMELVEYLLKSSKGRPIILEGGYITGANGLIPAWSNIQYNIPGACLLADTLPYSQLDPNASKELVIILQDRLNIEVSMEFLDKRIKQIEITKSNLKNLLEKRKSSRRPETGYIG
ncbi:MAG: PAC2 family protein [Candidatus Helarchaeota archaeon]